MASERDAVWIGVRLGVFQANALFGPVAFLILFATDHPFLAGEMFLGTVLGWCGWYRDFGLRLHPTKADQDALRRATPPEDRP